MIRMHNRPAVCLSFMNVSYVKRKFGGLGRVQSYVLEFRRTRGCREYTSFWMQAKSKQNEMSYPREKRDSSRKLIGIHNSSIYIERAIFPSQENEFHSNQLDWAVFFFFLQVWDMASRRNRVRALNRPGGRWQYYRWHALLMYIYLN